MRLLLCLLISTLIAAPAPAAACGPDSDCALGERIYRIDRPDIESPGALIFAHGYRGSAVGSMRNRALRRVAHEMGLAFVAADVGAVRGWMIPNRPGNRSANGQREYGYFDALIEQLVERHGIDRERIVMSGFSSGGMMTWELACNRGDRFAGFVPIAGTFWAPAPERCPSPAANLVHIHGTGDTVVPLRGRAIADSRQGNVFRALDLLHRARGFGIHREFNAGDLGCMRQMNEAGGRLVFCTHQGGHAIKAAWVRMALKEILGEWASD